MSKLIHTSEGTVYLRHWFKWYYLSGPVMHKLSESKDRVSLEKFLKTALKLKKGKTK